MSYQPIKDVPTNAEQQTDVAPDCPITEYDSKEGSIVRTLWAALNALFWLPICGGASIFCLFMIPLVGLTSAQRKMWRCASIYFRICLWASHVSYTVVGLDNLDPAGNYFFACNHQSEYDVPLIFAVLPFWLISISKASIACIPIFGWAVALAGTIFIDRSDHNKAVEALERARDDLIKRPRSVLLFPEGTRSADGRLQPFKKGGLVLAIKAGAGVVPVAIIGSRRCIGRALGLRPMVACHCTVVVGRPVSTEGMTVEDRRKLADQLQTQVGAMKDDWDKRPGAAGPAGAVEPLWRCFLPLPPADDPTGWARVPASEVGPAAA